MRGTRLRGIGLGVLLALAGSLFPVTATADIWSPHPHVLQPVTPMRVLDTAWDTGSTYSVLWVNQPSYGEEHLVLTSWRRDRQPSSQTLSRDPSWDPQPRLRVDRRGGAVAAWSEGNQVLAARRHPGQPFFRPPEVVAPSGSSFSLGVDADGDAVVAGREWDSSGSAERSWHTVASSQAGQPFGPPVRVAEARQMDASGVAVSPQGEVNLLLASPWRPATVVRGRPGEEEWTTEVIGSATAGSGCPQLESDADGRLLAVWGEGGWLCGAGGATLAARRSTGGAFGPPVQLGFAPDGAAAEVSVAPGGRMVVAAPAGGGHADMFEGWPGQPLHGIGRLPSLPKVGVSSAGHLVLGPVDWRVHPGSAARRAPDGRWEIDYAVAGRCNLGSVNGIAVAESGRAALVQGDWGTSMRVAFDRAGPAPAPECRPQSSSGPFRGTARAPLSARASAIRRRWRSGELTLEVACDRRCTVFADGKLKGRGVRSRARSSAHRRSRGPVTMRLRFPVKKRVMARSRKRRRAVAITVRVRARDWLGTRPTLVLRLKRRL